MNELRSLAKYVASVLGGADWEVRFTGQRGSEGLFDRPYCGIVPATPALAQSHGPAWAEVSRTFSVVAYPVEGVNAESSLVEAERVAAVLLAAFARGGDPRLYRRGRAHPRRVPRWDFTGLGLYESVTDADRISPMRVAEPPAFQTFEDAEGRWLVAGDVRLSWTTDVRVHDPAPLVAHVPITAEV